MKASVETKLGNVVYCFEVEEKSEVETLHKIAVLGNPPTICDVCGENGQENFTLTSNKDSEANCYVNVACKCGAKAKLGLYKSGGYFWKQFEKYVKKA
jgi:hypothetical protein